MNRRDILPPEFWLVLQYYKTIAAAVLIFLAAGFVFVIAAEDEYTSEARLLVVNHTVHIGPNDAVLVEANMTEGLIESQVEVLRSHSLGLRVVDALDLADDPEFVAEAGPLDQLLNDALGIAGSDAVEPSLRRQIALFLNDALGIGGSDAVAPSLRRQIALKHYLNNLSVHRVGLTYVVILRFTSVDPDTSARVLELLVREYLSDTAADNAVLAAGAPGWLRARAPELGLTAQVLTEPAPPITPSGPGSIPVLAAFGVAGAVVGLGAAVMHSFRNQHLRRRDDLALIGSEYYLGRLPSLKSKGRRNLKGGAGVLVAALDDDPGAKTFALQAACSKFLGRGTAPSATLIGVGSAGRCDGKTTVATNLAALLAHGSGQRVGLVDAARINPDLSKRFAKGRPGLCDCISGLPVDQAIVPGVLPGIDLLPFGAPKTPPSAMTLWGKPMQAIMETFKADHGFIVIDFSSTSEAIDLIQAAGLLDAIVLVTRSKRYHEPEFENLVEAPEFRDKLSGVIVNTGV
jgi:Mrp family chromosome partitioning ATPase